MEHYTKLFNRMLICLKLTNTRNTGVAGRSACILELGVSFCYQSFIARTLGPQSALESALVRTFSVRGLIGYELMFLHCAPIRFQEQARV